MKTRFVSLLFLSLVSFLHAGPVGAPSKGLSDADWPWWRGPNRDGVVADQKVPNQWGPNDKVIWKRDLAGRGHGSPTVVGDRVYLATADENTHALSVVCLNRSNGEVVWNKELHRAKPAGRIHARNSQASGSVACDGDRLFIAFLVKDKVVLSALTLKGEVEWQETVTEFQSLWGFATSPVIYKSLVILAAEHKGVGVIAAYERASGKEVWTVKRKKQPNHTSPVIFNLAGKDQMLICGLSQIASFDPMTGKANWTSDATTDECVGTVVAFDGMVYASGGYPKAETACVKADGSGEVVWTNNKKIYQPSLLAHDGYIYGTTDVGVAYCWNAETGKEAWAQRLPGPVASSPVLVGDRIFLNCENGKTVVFKATPKGYQQLGECALGTEFFASPTICGDRIYLRSAKGKGKARKETLYCVGAK